MSLRRGLVAVVLALGLLVPVGAARAQEGPDEVPTGQVPTQDIIPRPNSGEAPHEAGDRGGALQLAVLGLVVVAIAAGGLHLARQSRRARAEAPGQPAD